MNEDAGGGRREDRQLDEVLALLQARGADRRDYRRPALLRRVLSRMDALAVASLTDYLTLLHGSPDEVLRLSESIFVQFTSFFRDAAVFTALEERVLPKLRGPRPLRAWTIGVATGEEAYSLAMLLAGERERSGQGFEVLASDPDRQALERGRAGIYRAEALEDIPVRFRRFVRQAGPASLEPIEALRGRITFAEHDLRSPRLAPVDAIVAGFDLVLCRNVLTYLDDRFRAHAARRLASVVAPGGALVLGQVETLGEADGREFEPFPGVAEGLGISRRRGPDGDGPRSRST